MPHTLLDPATVPVVILAGGTGMRLREETERIPKPMVVIGEQPILWHIMSHYATHGFRRFIICLGYKSWVVKEYFLNFAEERSDLRIDLAQGKVTLMSDKPIEDWEVTLVDTGMRAGSTGRVLGVRHHIDTPYFMYTYGDGVSDVNLGEMHRSHVESGRQVTITGVKAPSRYGILAHDEDQVTTFSEKPQVAEGYISGGFFCVDSSVMDLMHADNPEGFFESDVVEGLATNGEVGIHRHHGFWLGMDTYRDYARLNDLWEAGEAPWKTWE